jgi:uncharacterized protein YfeS
MEKLFARWTMPSWKAVPEDKEYRYGQGRNAAYNIATAHYNFNEYFPSPVFFRPQEDINAELRKEAEEITNHDFDSYATKLAKKIDLHIISARLEGQLWSYSYLTVTVDVNGEEENQVWKTQMILNVSCLGKLFNQWPTRKVG